MRYDENQPIAQWFDDATGEYVNVSLDQLMGRITNLHMTPEQLHVLRQTIQWALKADPCDVSYRHN